MIVVGLLLAASFLDTEERPVPETVVGYTETTLEVAHRSTDIRVVIWYPTKETGTPELIAQNGLFYGFHALRDAVPVPQTLPIVVLSHGSGGRAVQMGWLATELAGRGMIVIGTNHPGTTSQDSDPFQTVKVWERPQDLSALLDFLLQEQPLGLNGDAARVAALGFSLGGHSALSLGGLTVSKQMFIDYCDANKGLWDCGWMQAAGVDFQTIDTARYEASYRDPRVGTVVAVDPALPQAVPDSGAASLQAEVLLVNLGQQVPEAMRVDTLASRLGASYSAIADAWHFSFLPECSRLGQLVIGYLAEDNICGDVEGRSRADVHAQALQIIPDYLEKHLIP